MRIKNTFLLLVLIATIIGSVLLAGCTKKETEEERIKREFEEYIDALIEEAAADMNTDYELGFYGEIDESEHFADIKTIHRMTPNDLSKQDETISYLSPAHPEIRNIKELTVDFTKRWVNRDYKTYKADEWLELYTESAQKLIKKNKRDRECVKFTKKHKLKTTSIQVRLEDVAMSETYDHCTVLAKLTFRLDDCTKKYEKLLNGKMKKGEIGQFNVVYFIKLDSNKWRISHVEILDKDMPVFLDDSNMS